MGDISEFDGVSNSGERTVCVIHQTCVIFFCFFALPSLRASHPVLLLVPPLHFPSSRPPLFIPVPVLCLRAEKVEPQHGQSGSKLKRRQCADTSILTCHSNFFLVCNAARLFVCVTPADICLEATLTIASEFFSGNMLLRNGRQK